MTAVWCAVEQRLVLWLEVTHPITTYYHHILSTQLLTPPITTSCYTTTRGARLCIVFSSCRLRGRSLRPGLPRRLPAMLRWQHRQKPESGWYLHPPQRRSTTRRHEPFRLSTLGVLRKSKLSVGDRFVVDHVWSDLLHAADDSFVVCRCHSQTIYTLS